MAKENEKKVSGDMSPEELENVAGGWCMTGGKSVPKDVKSVEQLNSGDGSFEIITTFQDGSANIAYFDEHGFLLKAEGTEGDN